jgi:hypothetical protein
MATDIITQGESSGWWQRQVLLQGHGGLLCFENPNIYFILNSSIDIVLVVRPLRQMEIVVKKFVLDCRSLQKSHKRIFLL